MIIAPYFTGGLLFGFHWTRARSGQILPEAVHAGHGFIFRNENVNWNGVSAFISKFEYVQGAAAGAHPHEVIFC